MSKVIVAGSINMDIVTNVARHPVPGETVFGQELNYFPGGKGANQAVASAKFGSVTTMIGHVGDDASGVELVSVLERHNIQLAVKKIPNTPTGTALIAVSTATSDNSIIVVPGANATLTPDDVPQDLLQPGDILLSQFEIPADTILAFFEQGRAKNTLNIFNAAPALPIPAALYQAIDILIINETELAALAGVEVEADDENSLLIALQKLAQPHLKIIVTLGAKGAILFADNAIATRIAGLKVKAIDTTGAGDCFCGTLASALAQQHDLPTALTFANRAAALSVTRIGAIPSMPHRDELS